MNIKTKIKNDMWRFNYVLPFIKKYQFDEKNRINIIKHILIAYKNIKPIKGKGKRTVGNDINAILSQIDIEFNSKSHFIYFIDVKKTIAVPGNIISNFTLNYEKIIHGSFQKLANAALGEDLYGQEAKAVIKGVENLVERIYSAIPSSCLEETVKKKQYSYFERILTSEAQCLEEALQRILFFNQILWQTRHRLNGLGRLDKILGDLYQHDIESGVIDKSKASDLIRDFLYQLSRYSKYKSDALEGDIGQIVILGGLNANGTYFSNELTEIFLREQAKLKKPDPKTLLRVSRKVPYNILCVAAECLLAQTGSPLISNDDVVIESLLQFGMSEIDAYEYCTSACWEPYIVGKSLDQNNIAVFDYFLAFDKVLKNEFSSFEMLVDSYIQENEKVFKKFLENLKCLRWSKDPLVSMFTTGCNEKRQDISDGACKYNNYGITTVALSNVIDSLFNIKKLVYEEKRYNLKELNTIRLKNYKGFETLFSELQNTKKYYGHDEVEVISLVNRITNSLAQIAINYKNQYGGTVKFGLSSPGYNILSKKTNADVAGRKFGMPYNTHISCMDASYTEIVNFAEKLSYDRQRFNGNVIDYFVTTELFEKNMNKFIIFLKGAIKTNFFQMQMNIMDSQTLIDAKAHPHKYTGLIVRVWGFSAYFNELPESYKDLLIERALAAEKII